MIKYIPGYSDDDEAYWQVLLTEGEHSLHPAPPPNPDVIWRDLGMAEKTSLLPPSPPPPADNGGWDAAFQLMEKATRLELTVAGYNRGGLLVEWDGHQGFVPVSHLADVPPYLDEKQREQELRRRVGSILCLRVIEVDPERSRLVLSERATRKDEDYRQNLLQNLHPGDLCTGRVTNICSFGAFVDLGGLEGLVHISEISWGRVDHPADALHPDQQVAVRVLNIDRERGRIGLSIKQALPDPWLTVEERYHAGQLVDGLITNVVDFGAFAQIEEGLEGLVHVSELAGGNFLHPRNVVQEGQTVTLRIISVDAANRRLGLSMRQAPRVSP